MIRNKLNLILKNKIVCSFILSIIVYSALIYQGVILAYNLFSILIFIFIYYITYKIDLSNKYKKDFIFLSLIFSIIFLVGNILYTYRYDSTISFFHELINMKNILYVIGNGIIIYLVLCLFMPKLIAYKGKPKENKNNKVFLYAFLIILVCWIPYYIIYYPGILTSDSISEFKMIMGLKPMSDHHTMLHIIYMMIPFKIGKLLFNNINLAVGLTSFIQMMLMTLTFAYSIDFLNKRKAPKLLIIGALIYYSLFPIHAFYSLTMWKDIVFSCSVVLLTIECVKLLERKNNITLKNSYMFVVVSILAVFSRNNGIYMYLLLAIISLIVFRKNIKNISIMLLIVFGVYLFVKGPVYNVLNIPKSKSSEYIAIPIQQIGRMAYKGINFTKKEEETINKLIPIKVLKEVYTPEIVDPIKFNKAYNAKAFENNKKEYLQLWLSLCLKHPKVAIESYLTSTLGYWYPGVEYWITTAKIDNNDLGIKMNSLVPNSIRNIVTKVTSYRIPILGYLYCIGFIFWIIALSIYITLKRKPKSTIYTYIPIIGIFITMLVAAPVYAEFRYVYAAYTTLPILIGIPFVKINK